MIKDVAQLEAEIEEFRKNIMSSGKLVAELQALTAEIKNERADLAKMHKDTLGEISQGSVAITDKADKLLESIENTIKALESEEKNARNAVIQSNTDVMTALQSDLSEYRRACHDLLENIRADNSATAVAVKDNVSRALSGQKSEIETVLSDNTQKNYENIKCLTDGLSEVLKNYSDKAAAVSDALENAQNQLEAKHSEYIGKLAEHESALEKSREKAEKKLLLALVCSNVITAALMIVCFILTR